MTSPSGIVIPEEKSEREREMASALEKKEEEKGRGLMSLFSTFPGDNI